MSPTLAELHAFAVDLAQRAGRGTLAHFQSNLAVESKSDGTPVTLADREAEAFLRREISAAFPDDGLIGEEYGEERARSRRQWILDPIDGTKSFIHGVPLYSVLIGIVENDVPIVGVIHLPALSETCSAFRGGGAWRNHERIHVSKVARLKDALVLASDIPLDGDSASARLMAAARLRRTWGDAYGFGLVAAGRADLFIEPELAIWDVAALIPIIEEAGGKITGTRGQMPLYAGSALASNGLLHDEALDLMRRST